MPDADVFKTCPRCAESVKGAALACRFCGHEFEPAANKGSKTAAVEPPRPANRPQENKGSKPITAWYILGGCGVVAIAIGIVVAFSHNQNGTISTNVQSTKAQSTVASVAVPHAESPAASGADATGKNVDALNQRTTLSPSDTPAPSGAPVLPKTSFDCTSAHSKAEKLICGNSELARLDVQIASLYRTARTVAVDPSVIESDQQQWLDNRNACASVSCLVAAYNRRKAELAQWVGPNP